MATKFSLKDPNPGVWFKFDSEDPDSGEIAIRAVNQRKRREIQRQCVKNRVEYKHGQRFEVQDTNDDLFSDLLWDYIIVDWIKLEDEDGKPIVCTTENKLRLMSEDVGFQQFVNACLVKLNEDFEDRVETIEKNSLSGSSVSKKNQTARSAKS
jgi:hypothetical protein